MERKVIVITGPTATGKTKLGVELALRMNGEVVSADSMQIYRGMPIGTAAPTEEEMRGVPHHLVGFLDPRENYSVGRYVEDASRCIDDILLRGRQPIVVGGTNLYIDSLLSGRDFAPQGGDTEVRRALEEEYDALGGEALHGRLAEVDPIAAARLHPNDRKRIVRALEVYAMTGKTLTEHDEDTKRLLPRYPSVKIALTFSDRQALYDRIDRRVEIMYARGLVREVEALLEAGVPKTATSLQAIGYKEILRAMEAGETAESAAEVIQQESRRYAKRQLSWLRRDDTVHWICWDAGTDFARGLQLSTEIAGASGI